VVCDSPWTPSPLTRVGKHISRAPSLPLLRKPGGFYFAFTLRKNELHLCTELFIFFCTQVIFLYFHFTHGSPFLFEYIVIDALQSFRSLEQCINTALACSGLIVLAALRALPCKETCGDISRVWRALLVSVFAQVPGQSACIARWSPEVSQPGENRLLFALQRAQFS
jgi:hypothetical protein